MKHSLIIIILNLFCAVSNAQIGYYDAIKLKGYTTEGLWNLDDHPNIWKSLRSYYPEEQDQITRERLHELIHANPFLINMIGGTLEDDDKIELINGGNVANAKALFGQVGGLNVTNVADGLSKFLVDRTKQELSITFFSKFKEQLDANSGLKELFPKTKSTLDVIDSEIYMYANYLNTMREAFNEDFKNLLNNLENYLKKVKNQEGNPELKNKIEYFQAALFLVNNIRQGVHPANAISKFSNEDYIDTNEPLLKIQEASKLFSIFSSSLRSLQPDRYWVSSDSLQLLMDPVTFQIYLGLLYQQDGQKKIFGKEFKTYLDKIATGGNSSVYQDYIQQLISESDQITLSIQQIKQMKTNGEKISSYSDLFVSTGLIMKNFEQLKLIDNDFRLNIQSTQVINVIRLSSDIYLDINEKKYHALVLDLAELLKEIFGEDFDWQDELIRYGTFIANVAQAENSDQVQSAIEAVALPVGSASIKRKTKFNIALNGYVGLAGGYEYIEDIDKASCISGVFTPVGIAFSKGVFDSCDKSRGSNSLFLSLVDITSFSTFRFGDSETDNLPEVTLENIFAPGLYYVRGLPKAPVSFGIGGQIGPQLRKLTVDGSETQDGITVSARFFVAVDIPLINFYTKSK